MLQRYLSPVRQSRASLCTQEEVRSTKNGPSLSADRLSILLCFGAFPFGCDAKVFDVTEKIGYVRFHPDSKRPMSRDRTNFPGSSTKRGFCLGEVYGLCVAPALAATV
jgi:hypothetical protein